MTSAAGSPYASPVLTTQTHHSVLSATQGTNAPQSPRAFYKVLENVSPGKRPESVASSTSISTTASSGDVSTLNDLLSENGISVTATESSQNKASHGSALLGLVAGNKSKKDKERHPQSSASSSHSGNGGGSSQNVKLISLKTCSFSGCTQPAKTCAFHTKKPRVSSPKKDQKEKDKDANMDTVKESNILKKLFSGSDKNASHGSISVTTGPFSRNDELLSPLPSAKCLKGFSKSMTSLSKDFEDGPKSNPVPVPHLHAFLSSPIRQRSPSVSVVDDVLLAAQQQRTRP